MFENIYECVLLCWWSSGVFSSKSSGSSRVFVRIKIAKGQKLKQFQNYVLRQSVRECRGLSCPRCGGQGYGGLELGGPVS